MPWVGTKERVKIDDDNNISIHCAYQAHVRAISKSIFQVDKYSGVYTCFFVIVRLYCAYSI